MENEEILSNEELLDITGGNSFVPNDTNCPNNHGYVVEPPYGLPDPRFWETK